MTSRAKPGLPRRFAELLCAAIGWTGLWVHDIAAQEDPPRHTWNQPSPVLALAEFDFAPVFTPVFSDDERAVAVSGEDRTEVRSVPDGRVIATIRISGRRIAALRFVPRAMRLVIVLHDSRLLCWSIHEARVIWSCNLESSPVSFARLRGEERVGSPQEVWGIPSAQLVCSADGQRIASSVSPGTVEVRAAANGEGLVRLRGHSTPVCALAFRPDGRVLASGSIDGEVHLWAMPDGREILAMNADARGPVCLRFSPQARTLALGHGDGKVDLLDSDNGSRISGFDAGEGPILSATFRDDGTLIAVGTQQSGTRVWSVSTGTLAGERVGIGTRGVFQPRCEDPISADGSGRLEWWCVERGDRLRVVALGGAYSVGSDREDVWQTIRRIPSRLELSPGGNFALLAAPGSAPQLLAIARPVHCPRGPTAAPATTWADARVRITLAGGGRILGHADAWVHVDVENPGSSDLRSVIARLDLPGHPQDRMECLIGDVAPGHHVAGSFAGTLIPTDASRQVRGSVSLGAMPGDPVTTHPIVFDVIPSPRGLDWERLRTVPGEFAAGNERGANGDPVIACAFAPDGKAVALAQRRGRLRVYALPEGNMLFAVNATDSITALRFTHAGRVLLAGGSTTLTAWNVEDGRQTAEFQDPGAGASLLALNSNESLLGTVGGRDGRIRVLRMPQAELLWSRIPASIQVESLAFSPDGSRVLSLGRGRMGLWDAGNGAELTSAALSRMHPWSAEFSPDARHLIVAHDVGQLSLCSARDGAVVRTTQTPYRDLMPLRFSPDGHWIAIADAHRVMIYDATGAQDLRILPGRIDEGVSLQFSPDGATLALGGSDGLVRLWSMSEAGGGLVLDRFPAGVGWVSFSADGTRLAAASVEGTVQLWRLRR